MRTQSFSLKIATLALAVLTSGGIYAQQPDIQFWRPNNKDGINVFETSKLDTIAYDGVKVRVGGDFAMQFQGLRQSNDMGNLVDLESNFNLPSANLNFDVQLHDGVRMHLRTYLSSRHHNDAWIKGGYMAIDKLNFIKEGFMENIMKYTTITVGMDEINYGDAHFRRSDNARAGFNPFVGNYIMDAFTTEAFGEVTVQHSGFLAVLGVSNGKLNQSVVVNENSDNHASFYGKLGYDKQLNDDLRVRLTGSWYMNQGTTTGTWLYGGDRAGARYYNVMHTVQDENGVKQGTNFDPRYNARFQKITAIQVNPFLKYKGFEFFGIYELADGNNEFTQPVADNEGAFTQLAGEMIYRFGKSEQFYVAARYNTIEGKMRESATDNMKISRINAGAGWFLTKNIMTKVEYVTQNYEGSAWTGRFAGAEFNGVVAEAVISF
jgi:hypothetical protein